MLEHIIMRKCVAVVFKNQKPGEKQVALTENHNSTRNNGTRETKVCEIKVKMPQQMPNIHNILKDNIPDSNGFLL